MMALILVSMAKRPQAGRQEELIPRCHREEKSATPSVKVTQLKIKKLDLT
jgi:hypothetical protein